VNQRIKTVRSATVIAWLPVLLAAVTFIGRNLTLGSGLTRIYPAVFILGSLATIATVPAAAVQWSRRIGASARISAWQRGAPGRLVGGAQLGQTPQPAARFAASCVILMALASIMVDAVYGYNEEADSAARFQAQLGGTIAYVRTPQQVDSGFQEVLDSFAVEYAVVAVAWSSSDTPQVTGAPADLRALDLDTTATSNAAIPAWLTYLTAMYVPPVVTAQSLNPADIAGATLVVTPRNGGQIDIGALQDQLRQLTIPAWSAEYPGEGWVAGSAFAQHQARWVYWFGFIAIMIALVSLWANYTNELLRSQRSLFAIQVMAPSDIFIRRVVGWRVLAPVVAAIFGGAAVTLILGVKTIGTGALAPPWLFVFAAVALIAASGVIAWLLTSQSVVNGATKLTITIPDE
jgi:hypothetical protein